MVGGRRLFQGSKLFLFLQVVTLVTVVAIKLQPVQLPVSLLRVHRPTTENGVAIAQCSPIHVAGSKGRVPVSLESF